MGFWDSIGEQRNNKTCGNWVMYLYPNYLLTMSIQSTIKETEIKTRDHFEWRLISKTTGAIDDSCLLDILSFLKQSQLNLLKAVKEMIEEKYYYRDTLPGEVQGDLSTDLETIINELK